jgi:phosphate starvation-inducible membrane PsiE
MQNKNSKRFDLVNALSKFFLFPLFIFGIIMKFYDKIHLSINKFLTKKDS